MENSTSLPKVPAITFDIQNADHKFYFGHYLNNAMHNVYRVFKHILGSINMETEITDQLQDCALLIPRKYKSYISSASLFEKLNYHFPVLEYLKENNNEEEVFTVFRQLLTDLRTFRNYFTHYNHPGQLCFSQFSEKSKFKKSMPYLFGSAVKAARKKTKLPHDAFDEIFKWKNKPGEEHTLEPAWQQEMMKQNSTAPTLFGLVFFTCLFLDVKEGTLFISRVKGLKNATEDRFKANREAFLAFSINMPKAPKLESSDIRLDMINELFRAPRSVFNKWDASSQQSFTKTNPDTSQQALMIRHNNRFDYFALRYFEDTGTLKNIYFQLKLGEAVLAEYEKQEPGGNEKTIRLVTKQLNAFGPLQYFHNHKNLESLGYDISELYTRQHIRINGMPVKYMPQFRITDNKIGLLLDDSENVPVIPTPLKSDNLLNGQHPYNFTNRTPDIILSTYELPNLFLYNHLNNLGLIEQPVAEFLKTYLKKQSTLFSGIVEDKDPGVTPIHFQKKRIPKKLREHLEGNKPALDRVKIKLNALIENTKRTIEKLEKQGKLEKGKNKKGITAGTAATWLATDIQFLTKPDDKAQKLSDFEYNTLQGYLAFFGSNQDKIDTLLQMHGITGTLTNRHPFLQPIKKIKEEFTARIKERQKKGIGPRRQFREAVYSLQRFFNDYLFERRRYFEGLLKNLTKETIDQISYFTKISDSKKTELNYREPVLFPRNVFNQAICEGLKNFMRSKNISYSEGAPGKCSPSFFLKQLMPELQDFYHVPRIYRKYELDNGEYTHTENIIIDKTTDLKNCQKKLKSDGPEYSELLNRIDNYEQAIRLEQYRDRVLLMMLHEFFNKQNKENINIAGKSLNAFSKDYTNDTVKTILDDEIDMSYRLYGVDITARLPISRYGAFRKILKDKRIRELLGYYDAQVPWTTIQEEIEYYDQNREEVLKICIEFEKAIHLKYGSQAINRVPGKHLPHREYLEYFHTNISSLPNEFFDANNNMIFNDLRNRFLHNQIIEKPVFSQLFPDFRFDAGLITKQVIESVVSTYSRLIQSV